MVYHWPETGARIRFRSYATGGTACTVLSSLSLQRENQREEEGQKVTETGVESSKATRENSFIKKRCYIWIDSVARCSLLTVLIHTRSTLPVCARALWHSFFLPSFSLLFFIFTDNDLSDVRSNWIFVSSFRFFVNFFVTFEHLLWMRSDQFMHHLIWAQPCCFHRLPQMHRHGGRTKGFERRNKTCTHTHSIT